MHQKPFVSGLPPEYYGELTGLPQSLPSRLPSGTWRRGPRTEKGHKRERGREGGKGGGKKRRKSDIPYGTSFFSLAVLGTNITGWLSVKKIKVL